LVDGLRTPNTQRISFEEAYNQPDMGIRRLRRIWDKIFSSIQKYGLLGVPASIVCSNQAIASRAPFRLSASGRNEFYFTLLTLNLLWNYTDLI
jgi:hypothetical protein